MEDQQTGRRFRALRHRLGWRQVDLAAKAGVSHGVVSLMERGRLEAVTLRKLRRVARELDAEFTTYLRWRGGDLDRLIDEAHATIVGRVVSLLSGNAWICRVEVSYSVYGERGSMDVLAFHPATGTLLVVEVKSELVAIEETLRKHDEKVRLARRVGEAQFVGSINRTARLLVLPSQSTARRRVERHEAVMRAAYPVRGQELRRWLASPAGAAAGLLFVETGENGPRAHGKGRKRIRARRAAG